MRGPLEAFNALSTKDNDTLYFITDSTNNQTLLYAGQSLISDSSSNLSPTAKAFLDNLPVDETQLNDGDFQVYVIESKEIDKIDPETGEVVIDPETGEPEKETIEEGHWETKSIDDLVPTFSGGASGLVPYAPATDGANKYLNGEGEWVNLNETVIQEAISAIMGEGELDESFDTLKEISDWILNHPSGATEINERLTALEEATGVNQTTTEEQPKVDEQGNPIYIQETQNNGEGSSESLYWDGLTKNDKTVENTGYPVMIPNLNGDEPTYVQEIDDDQNLLYWNVTDSTPKTTEDNGVPAFVQDTEEVQIPVVNDVEKLKTVIGNLDTNYTKIQQAEIGTISNRLEGLENDLSIIKSVVIGENESGIKIVPIGSLEALNADLHTYDENEKDTSSLVKALNMLDERLQWQNIPQG